MPEILAPVHPAPRGPKDRLIFALDVEHIDDAERLIERLAPEVGLFKVGPRLFTGYGHEVLERIAGAGSSVFLDLKFHDIPETVAGAVREVARRRVRMFTVHALGGAAMIRRATAELAQITLIPGVLPPQCLAVTVLTSHAPHDLEAIGIERPIVEEVSLLARLAMDSGAAGIVASGHELRALKPMLPERTLFITPGIRGQWDPAGDQARVMTAREAVEAGATYVVVGRPIRTAKSPEEAAKRFVDEIEAAEKCLHRTPT